MWGFFCVARMVEVFTHPTPGSPHIPRRWRPQPPAHPDRPHSTRSRAGRARCKADNAGQIVPAAGRWRAWSVSETEQICTHSNMNDFQHKNVCKTIDTNTRTCYYIDNTRTCYTTTKQEDKNHENHIKRHPQLCYN